MSVIQDIKSFNQFLNYFGFNNTEPESVFHIYRLNTGHKSHKRIVTPLFRQHYFDLSLFNQADFNYHYSQYCTGIKASTLQTVPPRQIQKIDMPEGQLNSVVGFSIYFKPEFLSTHFNNKNFKKDFPFFAYSNTDVLLDLDIRESIELNELFEKINQLYEHQDAFSAPIIKGYLWALLHTVKKLWLQRRRQKEITLKSSLVTQFETVVSENLSASLQIADISDMLNLSPKYLSESLKAECGQNAKELFEEMMLNESRALLGQSSLTVSEVAYTLGFAEHSSFSRFFKRLSGLSPSQYRYSRNSVQ